MWMDELKQITEGLSIKIAGFQTSIRGVTAKKQEYYTMFLLQAII
jgi:hypothetical protein